MQTKKRELESGGNLPERRTVAGYLHSLQHPPVAIAPSRSRGLKLSDESIADEGTDDNGIRLSVRPPTVDELAPLAPPPRSRKTPKGMFLL